MYPPAYRHQAWLAAVNFGKQKSACLPIKKDIYILLLGNKKCQT
jgi:hypothetical protein